MTFKRIFLPIALCCTAISACLSATPSLLSRADLAAANNWVDSVYRNLSPRERIAQLFIPMVDPTDNDTSRASIRLLVEDCNVGGLLFSEGTMEQYAEMTSYGQSLSKVPLMMTIDGEWGLSMRIKDTPRFPHNMGLGAISNENLLYLYGKEMARECRLMGIHVNFAPVIDVNSNPDNPVIGYRSFGEDPRRVAALGAAYSKGLEAGGVMAVAKHFPGHGDTSVDSHKALPTLEHSVQDLKHTDLVPFRRFINEGLSGVMVGHLSVPSLDPSGTPASLSRIITTDWLKNEMGFNGLVFTDALAMKGAVSQNNKCVDALLAGADVLLGSNYAPSDIRAIEKAIANNTLTQDAINERCKKMLLYKYLLGLNKPQIINTDGLKDTINSPTADDINQRLANGTITAVFNNANILPIRELDKKSIAVVNIGVRGDETFSQYCSKYAKVDRYSSLEGLSDATIGKIKKHDVIIVGVYNDNAASQASFAQLKDANGLIPVFFVNPYRMAKFGDSLKGIETLVLAYDNTPYTRRAAAQAIFGGISVTGRLPVNLEGIAPIGTGAKYEKVRLGYTSPTAENMHTWLTDSIDSLINVGIETKAFPGCQILVARGGNIVLEKSYGHLDYSKSTPVNDFTLYDLASVSKATGTLPGIMSAYDSGLINIDEAASSYIPGLKGTGKDSITIRQLLFHETGMPASLNVFEAMMDSTSYDGKLITSHKKGFNTVKIANRAYGDQRARLRSDILSTRRTEEFPHEAAKGIFVGESTIDTITNRIYNAKLRDNNSYNYSCLNFALLMDAEQRVTSTPHDQWVDRTVFAPLGMNHTCYRPLTRFSRNEIAPTENDVFMRRQLVHGYAHDELAGMSGGVQGNAGLFANAGDLAKLCQMFINNGKYGGDTILSESTVKLFTTEKSPTCRRGLGFDKPDVDNPDSSPTTPLASAATYGHLGFTGTCFWVDPENDIIFIFLTNRITPTRDNPAFSKLDIRPKLFEQIYNAMHSD